MNDNQELFIDESMIRNINDYNLIKDEIICEICQGILIKQKQCEICESIFCEKCINSWLAKNNSCPKRCDKFVIIFNFIHFIFIFFQFFQNFIFFFL